MRVVERDGRKPPFCNYINLGEIYTVVSDENDGDVLLETCDKVDAIDWFYLELVTPVEELEPYYIETETFDYEIRNENDDPDIKSIVAFHVKFQDPDEGLILNVKSYYESYVYLREHAEADAEAERVRLNAEWRKEQNHE